MSNHCRAGLLGDSLNEDNMYDLVGVGEVTRDSAVLAYDATHEIHTSASRVCFLKIRLAFSKRALPL